jgi:hypothetical protein
LPDATPKPLYRRRRVWLATAAGVVLLAGLGAYGARKIIAREALTQWLESRGIASEAEVKVFGLSEFTGRLRIGDPAHPDFTAERAEVTYGFRGFSLEVRSVKLTRPVLRARLHDGQLSVGRLDPLIEEFRRKPPRPGARKPRIEIDDGTLLLATDQGPVRITADALVDGAKLLRLNGTTAPAVLKDPRFEASLGTGSLKLTTHGDRTDASLDAPILAAKAGGLSVEAGRLQASATAPYPDLKGRREDGAVVVQASLTGRSMTAAGQDFRDARISAGFTGQARGWISDLLVTGEGTANLQAAGVASGPAAAGGVRAAATASAVRWSRKGGDAVSTRLRIALKADQVDAKDLRLEHVSGVLHGPLTVGPEGNSISLSGGVAGRGGWRGIGPPVKGDSAEIAALKRGARRFAFSAPGVALSADNGPMRLALLDPVTLRTDAGGVARLGLEDEGYRLSMAGGGLPRIAADVDRFALLPGGAMAGGRVRAALSIGPVEKGEFDASGTVRIADGAVRFTADACASVRAAKLELGANDVEKLAGRFCPDGRPMLSLAGGGWELAGRAEGVAAEVPFLQARVAEATARVAFGEKAGRLHATAAIADAELSDAAATRRFNPLRMSGQARLANEVWTADLGFRVPGGAAVAQAHLTHDGRTGAGGVDVDTGPLAFAEGGLQPAQLSPLAEALGSPATGQARFTGGFRWTKAATTSGGTLSVPRLDFKSPAGQVTGLSGDVVFTSLAPLAAAPGQVLRAERVAAFAPLTGVTATFGITAEALHISGGQAAAGGGTVRIESLDVPLDPKAALRGVLLFDGVQLHDLVEASPFGDHVELDAKVSGRIPFERKDGKVRITGGTLQAVQPGRLSIQRAALTGVQTLDQAPQAAASTDTFTDFAYQAMENLAFDRLEAAIDTHPDGRLGVLFHITGRHDPPQKQEIRLSWLDLIRRNFLNKKLPLPSGTGVDLTLDTTLNLDELLADYAEYERLRNSGPVQP